ncbi:unnamed protein product [marine sediment metagenome]|uniref:Uncharacterized protein n=1 Tax=marine sediment metagenome TaxID=412755 RepID=X0T9H3_9ZZZZ
MVRKNPKEYSSVGLKKTTIKKLSKYKIHPNQSMQEVIKKFLDEKEGK